MKILESIKNWWNIDAPNVIEGTVPDAFMPLVTKFDPLGHEAGIMDNEGTYWGLKRSGDLVYLSGEDGLVQAQFNAHTFKDFARFAGEIASMTEADLSLGGA